MKTAVALWLLAAATSPVPEESCHSILNYSGHMGIVTMNHDTECTIYFTKFPTLPACVTDDRGNENYFTSTPNSLTLHKGKGTNIIRFICFEIKP